MSPRSHIPPWGSSSGHWPSEKRGNEGLTTGQLTVEPTGAGDVEAPFGRNPRFAVPDNGVMR